MDDLIEFSRAGGGTELAPGVLAPAGTLRMQFSRGGGPGGQNVNKLNTRAELWARVEPIIGISRNAKARLRALAGSRLTVADEIHLVSEAQRSQEANRQDALLRLRDMILKAKVEPKVRRKTKPSRASKQRRLDHKRHRGSIKTKRRRPDAADE